MKEHVARVTGERSRCALTDNSTEAPSNAFGHIISPRLDTFVDTVPFRLFLSVEKSLWPRSLNFGSYAFL